MIILLMVLQLLLISQLTVGLNQSKEKEVGQSTSVESNSEKSNSEDTNKILLLHPRYDLFSG